jgi:hypothetical protein
MASKAVTSKAVASKAVTSKAVTSKPVSVQIKKSTKEGKKLMAVFKLENIL